MPRPTSTRTSRSGFFRRNEKISGSRTVMSRGIFPSSSLYGSGRSRIGENALNRPTPDVLLRPNRISLGSGDTNQQALMYRVSDQDGAVEVGRHGSVRNPGKPSHHIGKSRHGAKTPSGMAAMSGNGMMDRGPEHLHQPPDGNGSHEHDQQSRTARRCLAGSIRSALFSGDEPDALGGYRDRSEDLILGADVLGRQRLVGRSQAPLSCP